MSTNLKSKLISSLKSYRKKYLIDKYKELDESATRIMVNNLLVEVLGYQELEEVKTEYAIKGTYSDYVIQVGRKKHFIVEVKAIQIDLNEKHLRQAVNYAANEGIDWVLLTNGRTYELHRVIFGKPITSKRVCCFDLCDNEQLKQSGECFMHLTRKMVEKNNLEKYWRRFQALEPINLSRHILSSEFLRLLRKKLKKETKITFNEKDIFDSLYQVISDKIEIEKPTFRSTTKKGRSLKKVISTNVIPTKNPLKELFQAN